MYIVSPDYLDTANNNNVSIQPPPSKATRKPPGAEKKRYSKKRPVQNRKTKKKKKDTATHAYDKWVKIRAQLHEADVQRKRQTNTIFDFLKRYYRHLRLIKK
jgi:hypothetical protein